MLQFVLNTQIIPDCVFVLVAVPERVQLPTKVRAPAAVAKPRAAVSVAETRPQFGKRILEERRQPARKHDSDDWFVLFDVGPKESGIPRRPVWAS